MVKDAEIGDVVADFINLRGQHIAAQNASFDMGFLDRMGKKNTFIDNTVVDNMVLAAENYH